MKHITKKEFTEGSMIIEEGQKGDEAYIIDKGTVEIYKSASDGSQFLLTELKAGQVFGEMCLFDNKVRSASVQAKTNVVLQIIPKDVVLDYLEKTPPLIRLIIEVLLKRLRLSSDLITQLKMEADIYNKSRQVNYDDIKNLDYPT